MLIELRGVAGNTLLLNPNHIVEVNTGRHSSHITLVTKEVREVQESASEILGLIEELGL